MEVTAAREASVQNGAAHRYTPWGGGVYILLAGYRAGSGYGIYASGWVRPDRPGGSSLPAWGAAGVRARLEAAGK